MHVLCQRVYLFLLILLSLGSISCNPLLNLGIIVPNRFIRSGQPDTDDLKNILPQGIKTIINLKRSVEKFEQQLADEFGVELVHIRMSADYPPTEAQLENYFSVLDRKSSYPIWMHCQGGADRTGIMTAIYRIEYQNWSKNSAILEMIRYFHIPPIHPRLTTYIRNYQRRRGTYQETPGELLELQEIVKKIEDDYQNQ